MCGGLPERSLHRDGRRTRPRRPSLPLIHAAPEVGRAALTTPDHRLCSRRRRGRRGGRALRGAAQERRPVGGAGRGAGAGGFFVRGVGWVGRGGRRLLVGGRGLAVAVGEPRRGRVRVRRRALAGRRAAAGRRARDRRAGDRRRPHRQGGAGRRQSGRAGHRRTADRGAREGGGRRGGGGSGRRRLRRAGDVRRRLGPGGASSTSTRRPSRSWTRSTGSDRPRRRRSSTTAPSNGGFKTIDEIKEVPGIGDAKFAAMKDSITV